MYNLASLIILLWEHAAGCLNTQKLGYSISLVWFEIFQHFPFFTISNAPQLRAWRFCGVQYTLVQLGSGLKTPVYYYQCRQKTAESMDHTEFRINTYLKLRLQLIWKAFAEA